MPASRQQGRMATAAVLLLFAALILAGLCRIVGGTQRHSYSPGAAPPAYARVIENKTYQLAVPGGVHALQGRGVDVAQLQCQWSAADSGEQLLDVSSAGANSKATNTIGTFVSPYTGAISVDCSGWGAVFIDDAEGAAPDLSGLFLVLCILALTAGAALALAALRAYAGASRRPGRPSREDEEVERFVHLVHVRSEDGEVGRGDGPDVT
ncbi:hypothetical protein M6B22_03930 [Jatrophihabitans cynanchi]|jgi:hypothetical protein|uniref:Uncharacterized protein n=1 Tax=Jatrophihabitans cynanchi TaxID=2944128 RepID=A0ABY7K161_9ACTN|nr:hypothetical protein [Jatrophihabitans sp. SB3-54]WAX57920.1 hypothetical protein M6B22_03930 [Jatrophihabitans sp. SB3-54]